MNNTEFTAAHKLLGNRSSKILGGYVTEHMLLETFMSSDMVYTKSWWYSSANRQSFWFVEKATLSRLDHRICDLLTANKHRCFQLYLDDDQWKICEIKTGAIWTVDEFIGEFSLKKIKKGTRNKSTPSADEKSYERKMLEKCITFYQQTGMLEDIQRSIQIEDLFLNQYFYTSNIDLFFAKDAEGELEPICMEIKFKNAFSPKAEDLIEGKAYLIGKKLLGVEKFQMERIFPKIEKTGMRIFVVILYDSYRDYRYKKSTNIFRYLEAETQLEWLFAQVSHAAKYGEYLMESEDTAFTNTEDKPRPVYCIPKENFDTLTDLQTLIESDKLLNSDGTEVRLCPQCGRRSDCGQGNSENFGDAVVSLTVNILVIID